MLETYTLLVYQRAFSVVIEFYTFNIEDSDPVRGKKNLHLVVRIRHIAYEDSCHSAWMEFRLLLVFRDVCNASIALYMYIINAWSLSILCFIWRDFLLVDDWSDSCSVIDIDCC